MARSSSYCRTKTWIIQELCADCGAPDPGWASLNRGVVVCDECCSVHRSLGRHVSHVKSLKKGIWHSSLLSMIQSLSSSGANNIWEHTLLDPSVSKGQRKKPQPKDDVHPTKANFIRTKYQNLSFVHRPEREDCPTSDGDVSRQLHSSVRTGNLETSLRLLSQGADPNFFHPEKGTCPLHVATKANQLSQIELLVIYGADPGVLDSSGVTPIEYARNACQEEVADRYVDLQYELTDTLSYYLCGSQPDHRRGQHWLIPDDTELSDLSNVSKEARFRLIKLSNALFEELVSDVYDEVDRRQTDSIWLSMQSQAALLSDRCSVPFLPLNPDYSSTRNQGRQKLARLNGEEFRTLVRDVLVEAQRRSLLSETCSNKGFRNDDEPLYDSVASEDDYSLVDRQNAFSNQFDLLNQQSNRYNALQADCIQVSNSDGPEVSIAPAVSIDQYLEMKRQLEATEARVRDLQDNNVHMKAKLQELSTTVVTLREENDSLRIHGSPSHDSESKQGTHVPSSSPCSKIPPYQSSYIVPSRVNISNLSHVDSVQNGDKISIAGELQEDSGDDGSLPILPSQDIVVQKTEVITRKIQDLLKLAQEAQYAHFIPCSQQINVAVRDMAELFPRDGCTMELTNALRVLVISANRLHSECRSHVGSQMHMLDPDIVSQQVIQCAYDIAKAAKCVVTLFQ